RTHAAAYDANFHLIGRELLQCILENLYRTLHVRLQDGQQLFQFSGLHGAEEAFQTLRGTAREFEHSSLVLPERTDLLCLGHICDYLKLIARRRHALKTEHLDRGRGTGLLYGSPTVVEHGSHATEEEARYYRISNAK